MDWGVLRLPLFFMVALDMRGWFGLLNLKASQMMEQAREQRFHIKIYKDLKKKGFPVKKSIPVLLRNSDYIL